MQRTHIYAIATTIAIELVLLSFKTLLPDNAIVIVSIFLFIIGVFVLLWALPPLIDDLTGRVSNPRSTNLTIGSKLAVGSILSIALLWIYLKSEASISHNSLFGSEKIPGVSVAAAINIHDPSAIHSKYLIDLSDDQNSHVSFYLSRSDRFVFIVTDVNGDPYPLYVPAGIIPIDKFIHLIFEVGISGQTTSLHIVANGKEVDRENFNFRIELGDRNWRINIGSDVNNLNQGSYDIKNIGVWPSTFTEYQINALTENAVKYDGVSPE